MMSLLFLTIFLCLSTAVVYNNNNFYAQITYTEEPPYSIHHWVQHLQLQTCALVSIGLKYFAIFIENIIDTKNTTITSTKYFIGICHQSTLENWDFCSTSLTKKRKHKCRFKVKPGIYQPRVYRKFCDLTIMVNNSDCTCENTIDGEHLIKVIGFPTCYIPPLPHTLCKYNVCGLSSCEGFTQNDLHTVQCDPKCTNNNPFCEGPIHRTSKPPEINSQWSRWSRELENGNGSHVGESPASTMKTKGKNHRSIASCINKYTEKPDLDCLGPGTGCCASNHKTCTCSTFEKDGGLKVERNVFIETDEEKPRIQRELFPRKLYRFPVRRKKDEKSNFRFLRGTDYDIEDDEDDNDDDLGEDVVLEEDTEPTPIGTTVLCEPCEKGEIDQEVEKSIAAERILLSKNNTLSKIGHNSAIISLQKTEIFNLVVINSIILNKLL